MTALALEWFWWIFATFGIVGIVALWIFAPTAATLIGKAILAFFKFVFGYRIGCAIVAAILAFLAADYHRARLDEADWKKQTAAFDAAQQKRDIQIDANARASVRAEIDAEQQASIVTDKQKDDFDVSLKPLPATDNVCRVGADLVKLRLIAGGTQGKAHRSMPKIGRLRFPAKH
jgi:hypothetical protein